jgi:hypothetical protein
VRCPRLDIAEISDIKLISALKEMRLTNHAARSAVSGHGMTVIR